MGGFPIERSSVWPRTAAGRGTGIGAGKGIATHSVENPQSGFPGSCSCCVRRTVLVLVIATLFVPHRPLDYDYEHEHRFAEHE